MSDRLNVYTIIEQIRTGRKVYEFEPFKVTVEHTAVQDVNYLYECKIGFSYKYRFMYADIDELSYHMTMFKNLLRHEFYGKLTVQLHELYIMVSNQERKNAQEKINKILALINDREVY